MSQLTCVELKAEAINFMKALKVIGAANNEKTNYYYKTNKNILQEALKSIGKKRRS